MHLVALDGYPTTDRRTLHVARVDGYEVPVLRAPGPDTPRGHQGAERIGRATITRHDRKTGLHWSRAELWAETFVAVPPGWWLSPSIAGTFQGVEVEDAPLAICVLGAKVQGLTLAPVSSWPWPCEPPPVTPPS